MSHYSPLVERLVLSAYLYKICKYHTEQKYWFTERAALSAVNGNQKGRGWLHETSSKYACCVARVLLLHCKSPHCTELIDYLSGTADVSDVVCGILLIDLTTQALVEHVYNMYMFVSCKRL